MPGITEKSTKKRKLDSLPEIEIDVSAAEPPSKKALRKAKKNGIDGQEARAAVDFQSDAKGVSDSDEKVNNGYAHAPVKHKAPTIDSAKRSVNGVWVGNLAFTTTKEDLRKFFTAGCSISETEITRIHVPAGSSKQNGVAQNKGFAYVDFATKEAMDEAIGLSERLLTGRRLLIKDAKNYEGRPEPHQKAGVATNSTLSKMPPSRRIFVGNLGFEVTKEVLEEHLSPCGPITNIHMATFEDSGKCKGYAWVEFESMDAATAAVKGFVLVNEEGDIRDEDQHSDHSSEEESAGKKRLKMKKILVNRLFGRQLRMEFAEDPASRYRKRFGKERQTHNNLGGAGTPVQPDLSTDERFPRQSASRKWQGRDTASANSRPEYSSESVQRLTGAIVEAKGKKTTFDS